MATMTYCDRCNRNISKQHFTRVKTEPAIGNSMIYKDLCEKCYYALVRFLEPLPTEGKNE